MVTKLSADEFALRVRLGPLVSIDLILRDAKNAILLGLRNNEPAKGSWFVPGGIISKDERIAAAFRRILADETALAVPFSEAQFIGVYEHFYSTNTFGDPEFGTHYVVLAYELRFDHHPITRRDKQHRRMRWMAPADLLIASDVHDYTKAYFR